MLMISTSCTIMGRFQRLPLAKSCLPLAKSCLPLAKSCLPLAKSYLPLAKSCLPLAKSCLPLAKSCLPLAKSCLPLAKSCLPLANARFTLADPMPRLGSDVVGGNSGRNHPTSRRHTIHIGRVVRNASVGTRESYIIVRLPGWYGERVLFITTLNCVVHVRLPIGRRRRAILNMFNIAR